MRSGDGIRNRHGSSSTRTKLSPVVHSIGQLTHIKDILESVGNGIGSIECRRVTGPVSGLGVRDGAELRQTSSEGLCEVGNATSQYRHGNPRNRPAGNDKEGYGLTNTFPPKAGRRPSKDEFPGRHPHFHSWLH